MPVRDALSRLAAEGAVDIRSKRAVMVVPMTPARFDDIMRCRLLLEPAAAIDALPYIDAARLRAIRKADEATDDALRNGDINARSEEHTSELQSLMRISYAVFCLKKKKKHT